MESGDPLLLHNSEGGRVTPTCGGAFTESGERLGSRAVSALPHRFEKILKKAADQIGGDDKGKIEKAIKEAREALNGNHAPATKCASERWNETGLAVSAEAHTASTEGARAKKSQPHRHGQAIERR